VFNGMKRLFIPAVRLGRNIQSDSCAHRRETLSPPLFEEKPSVCVALDRNMCVLRLKEGVGGGGKGLA